MPNYIATRPSWTSSSLELRQDGVLIGELAMLKKWSYALAEARMPERTVRFGYSGWTMRTLFMQDETGNDIAAVKSLSSWNRDTAVEIDGITYTWKQKNWWGTQYAWLTSDGTELMQCHMDWWNTLHITVPNTPSSTEMLLLFFGMYLAKMREMDSAAAGM